MIKFGPSGNCDWFYENHKSTLEVAKWLSEIGLDAYEYPFTRGVNLSDENAKKLGEEFKKYNIEVTAHAPYYINLANPDDMMIAKSFGYLLDSVLKMRLLGCKKLVFHPGSMMKLTREQAQENIKKNLKAFVELLKEKGINDVYLCPETMGKHGQMGTVEEIAELCAIDEMIIPTLDFGHINSFCGGSLKSPKDYEEIFLKLKAKLGDRFNNVHIHFSKIEYSAKGEVKHLRFDTDTENYGPCFEDLVPVLKKYNIQGEVICESHGSQSRDALIMKQKFYENIWFFVKYM